MLTAVDSHTSEAYAIKKMYRFLNIANTKFENFICNNYNSTKIENILIHAEFL